LGGGECDRFAELRIVYRGQGFGHVAFEMGWRWHLLRQPSFGGALKGHNCPHAETQLFHREACCAQAGNDLFGMKR